MTAYNQCSVCATASDIDFTSPVLKTHQKIVKKWVTRALPHVDTLDTHGLSCRKSQGRHPRHASINILVQRHLSAAGIPSHLETTGIRCSDGTQPDGASIMPWSCGRILVWDATCPDTLVPSHIALASREPGLVAEQAEQEKTCWSLTTLSQLALRLQVCLDPKPTPFSRSLDITSRPILLIPVHSAIFCKGLGSPFNERTLLLCLHCSGAMARSRDRCKLSS